MWGLFRYPGILKLLKHIVQINHYLINISACNCKSEGSSSPICNKETGKCTCKDGFTGDKCDQCAAGHFGSHNCTMIWKGNFCPVTKT